MTRLSMLRPLHVSSFMRTIHLKDPATTISLKPAAGVGSIEALSKGYGLIELVQGRIASMDIPVGSSSCSMITQT
jgi:hypothetical protein